MSVPVLASHSPPLLLLSTPRIISTERLTPFPEAVNAYMLWRSIPRAVQPEPLIAAKDPDRQFLWCGGFGGLPQTPVKRVAVRFVPRGTPGDVIRELMWHEAISTSGVRNADMVHWIQMIRHHLPDDLLRRLFGTREIGPSGVARAFGVTRQTAAKYLHATHD